MSFVTTAPEALTAAAGKLAGIGSALGAENAAAAPPTTGVVPAAADAVSALQATQFSAYGTLYQHISAQAAAIHEMFVHTLTTSANSYGATEAANSTAAGSSGSGLGLISLLTGQGAYELVPGAASNSGIVGIMQLSNFGSAASDLLQLGSAGFLAPGTLTTAGIPETWLAGAAAPAAAGGAAGAPVVAGLGQAPSIGALSVPPSWAAAGGPAAGSIPATSAGWSAAAPHSTPVNTLPTGLPSVATAGKTAGFGAPRYGVKPTVMPRPSVV
ncbi:PE domain-containing protein [Mycobacterium sp.]|uniref:PPE family protein, SVP subgroup n=1 Tax=Mycobacterium sp. TaxID=1785 RepID=UPI00126F9AD8|nr:PE domain-containing protein [Mycobacterium sp.]KAA8966316.1 MAG: PE domain-containing protein [Mycobacterium sp.]